MPILLLWTVIVVTLIVEIIIAYRLYWAFRHFSPPQNPLEEIAEDELPSVTVCIPARNEKHAMTLCLESVVASRYPKLEIIVLDDESQDDTSLLIKSFAHAGVRFVEGSPLPDGWLGKNHALDGLLDEASGKYVLFMDVDTRIDQYTIGRLVNYMMNESADMVSVLPSRHQSLRGSVVFATMRFFWEVLFQRRTHPAVASSAWMIKRKVLTDDLGGFDASSMETRPEVAIARTLAAKDRYRFVISGTWLGLSYEKKWASQLQTSLRLNYPGLGYSWLKSFAVIIALLLTFMPWVYLMAGVVGGRWIMISVMSVLCLLQVMLYGWYVSKVWPRGWLLGGIVLPVLICVEIWLVLSSALLYMRKKVTWKGRPIAKSVTRTASES